MANSDRVYLVVPQEPCHTGVMGTFGPLVVQRSPGDGELLPVADLFAGHVGDRDPVGSSPARVDLAIICDWHAYPHAGKPPRRSPEVLGASGFPRSQSNQTRKPALRLWPDHAPGRRQMSAGAFQSGGVPESVALRARRSRNSVALAGRLLGACQGD